MILSDIVIAMGCVCLCRQLVDYVIVVTFILIVSRLDVKVMGSVSRARHATSRVRAMTLNCNLSDVRLVITVAQVSVNAFSMRASNTRKLTVGRPF